MSTGDIVVQLGLITQQINRYAPIILLLFGIVGNLLNCLVFTRRNLRSTPCSVYFLAASITDLIIFVTIFTPLMIDGWNARADLTETVPALCKLLLLVVFSTRSIAAWMIAFAAVDRYLVSSPNIHRRQMSSLKNTYRCILLICVLLPVIWLEVIFCFDVNMVGTTLSCSYKSNTCGIYSNIAQTLIMIIIPVAVMLVFGFYTIRNIHQRRRVAPNNINRHPISRNRRSENSLTKMLLTQVFLLTLMTLPFAILTLYQSYTYYQNKSSIQQAIEDFLFNIFVLVVYIPNCISFCLYTLSGSLFRETFFEIVKRIIRRLTCYQ